MVKIHVTDDELDEAYERLVKALESVGAKLTDDIRKELYELKELAKQEKIDPKELAKRLSNAVKKALGVE